jgi:Cu(I)/Ag(I) efflux system membrane protein CusA/SilA
VLSITLVPALIPIFLKGRIRSENENWLVRTMIEIFKPMLAWLMDRTTLVIWLFVVIVGLGYVASRKLGREFMPDLNEGTILEMPTTVPRVSVTQAGDDLRVRDAILRGFPEVWQVVGKAGRAETATDPAPLDMIETIINLRDHDLWPKRKLLFDDIVKQTRAALESLEREKLISSMPREDREPLVNEVAMNVSVRVDESLRALATQRLAEFRAVLGHALVARALDDLIAGADQRFIVRKPTADEREKLINALATVYGSRLAVEPLADDVTELAKDAAHRIAALGVVRAQAALLAPRPSALARVKDAASEVVGLPKSTAFTRITDGIVAEHRRRLKARTSELNWELFDQAVAVATDSALDELMKVAQVKKLAARPATQAELAAVSDVLKKPFDERILLWPKTKNELIEEMSTALQMPGWGNSFTQPIANRIEMLSTGVRSDVAVKIFGSNLDAIQRVSQDVAGVLRGIRGAADVFPDQITGKPYVEIHIDRKRAARYGIAVGDVQDVVEVAMGGRPLTVTVEGRERYPVRVRYARDYRHDVEALKRILVSSGRAMASTASGEMQQGMGAPAPSRTNGGAPLQVPLAELADIKVVEGPSMIKSENGLLRAYVQANVRGRDEVGFVEEAQRVVAEKVTPKLPAGMYIEWGGKYEHQVRAQQTLRIVFPAVIATIVIILYLTHKSWVDALLLMTSVVGALAGGAIFQWLFGFPFSVAVQVGYIACFGMAVETGVVMLVYLREAIDERGGLGAIRSIDDLRQAILEGAVHRLRPKLLTEGAAIIAIAPMLWATGVGAEVIRPMAAPVLGGLLIADEVIDVFLPVLYFAVQKRRWARLHGVSLWSGLGTTARGHAPSATPVTVNLSGAQDVPNAS